MAQNSDQADLFGGIALGIATLAALLIANSALGPQYNALIHATAEIRIGSIGLSKSLEHWVNDGLMTIFFLLVGLEIKREIIEGELNSLPKVILPGAAAIGGMLVPALVFSALNWHNDYSMRGWAIPTATDIAFSLGVLSLLGSRVPLSLKIFLMALAIFDDLGAIIVIALFYSSDISFVSLALALVCIAGLVLLNRLGVKR